MKWWPVAGILAAMCVIALAAVGVSRVGMTLDRAQAEFEADFSRGRGYNFEGARMGLGGMSLRCRDTGDALRTCVLMLQSIDPVTREAGGFVLEPFACSREICDWTFTGAP